MVASIHKPSVNTQNTDTQTTYKLRTINQRFTQSQQDEFANSAIAQDVLELNVSILDTTWVVDPLDDRENEDILTLADILGIELERDAKGHVRASQLKRLTRMQGGWHILPFYGLADRAEVNELRFKPTVPEKDKNGKPIKYIGLKGGTNRIFFPNVPDRIWKIIAERYGIEKSENCFGEWLLANPVIPALVDEGEKKTMSTLSLGFASVGVNGCYGGFNTYTNEDSTVKYKELNPDLKALAVGGRTIYLTFDRDLKSKTVRTVSAARKETAKLLYEAGAGRVFSIVWDAKKYKGVDDFIAAEGEQAFIKAMSEAFEIPPPKPKIDGDEKKPKLPSPLEMADSIADNVFKTVRYDAELSQWMEYDGSGKWLQSPDTMIFALVQAYMEDVLPDFTPSYLKNCLEFARSKVIVRKWAEASSLEFMPFKNGVLDLKNNRLLPHDPEYKFTWQLPRDYSVIALGHPQIDAFLDWVTCGRTGLRDVLEAYLNAVLKGRWDLQKFILFSGTGANGKGVLLSLMTALVGENNTHSTTLNDLNNNRFESSNLRGKRLVVMPDEDKYKGNLNVFKNATGDGMLRYERKGKDSSAFAYRGMIAIASNPNNILFAGEGYAIQRRRIDFPCAARIGRNERVDLTPVFAPELSSFTSYLLSLNDDWVSRTLRNADNVADIAQLNWDFAVREDSVTAFCAAHLIPDAQGSIPCGQLYAFYEEYCQSSGLRSKSINNFTPTLLELCNDTLELEIEAPRIRTGRVIKGLRLRSEAETGLETIFTQGKNYRGDGQCVGSKPSNHAIVTGMANPDGQCVGSKPSNHAIVTGVTTRDGQCVGSKPSNHAIVTGVTGQLTSLEKFKIKTEREGENEGEKTFPPFEKDLKIVGIEDPSQPSRPTHPAPSNGSDPTRGRNGVCTGLHTPAESAPSNGSDPTRGSDSVEKLLRVGDRARVKGTSIEGVIDGWGRERRTGWLILADGSLSETYPADRFERVDE